MDLYEGVSHELDILGLTLATDDQTKIDNYLEQMVDMSIENIIHKTEIPEGAIYLKYRWIANLLAIDKVNDGDVDQSGDIKKIDEGDKSTEWFASTTSKVLGSTSNSYTYNIEQIKKDLLHFRKMCW